MNMRENCASSCILKMSCDKGIPIFLTFSFWVLSCITGIAEGFTIYIFFYIQRSSLQCEFLSVFRMNWDNWKLSYISYIRKPTFHYECSQGFEQIWDHRGLSYNFYIHVVSYHCEFWFHNERKKLRAFLHFLHYPVCFTTSWKFGDRTKGFPTFLHS